MRFFTCSVGKPGEEYTEKNLERIIENKGFVLHNDTQQKGTFDEISAGDIIILRYNEMFIAYGTVKETTVTENFEWNHWAFVEEWFFYNKSNPKIGVSRYGIDSNTIGGGKYGTVKTIKDKFAILKIGEIDSESDSYKKIILHFQMKSKIQALQNYSNLLKYKKQIILQGPPGTGKTKLAKEIAYEILNENPENLTPTQMIEVFFKEGKSNFQYNKDFKDKLLEFYQFFPKDELDKMELDEYCIGKSNNTNFCWWIERGLEKYGKFTPGNSGNYIIYFSKDDDDYRVKKNTKEGIIELFPKIKTALTNLVVKEDISNAAKIFGESFIIKILNTYYPEKYFPINGRSSLVNLMKIFDEPYKTISTLDLNQAIQSIFNNYKDKYPSSITSLDFMLFLYKHFNLKDDGAVTTISQSDNVFRKPSIIQFHPSYTYEDFIRGIISKVSEKGIEYKVENKILAELAYEALENPFANYVLIIDEINRANLSAVLGELIYTLEYRGKGVDSMYAVDNDKKLILPPNLYIIGTMNTADRSVGHIDYAVRRRFAFVDVLPKDLSSEPDVIFMKEEFETVTSLFVKNYDSKIDYNENPSKIERSEHLTHDFAPKDVWLGHSYFIQQYEKDVYGTNIEDKPIDFNLRIKYEIKPILEEYIKDGILKEMAREVINSL